MQFKTKEKPTSKYKISYRNLIKEKKNQRAPESSKKVQQNSEVIIPYRSYTANHRSWN